LNTIPIDSGKVFAWRLDQEKHAAAWDSGYGAALVGGRWNLPKVSVVYASLDPALCVLEKAVHSGFASINTVPHTLTKFCILANASISVVTPEQVPNPNWLRPCGNNSAQQRFLASLLSDTAKPFVLIPSVVSPESWNVLFDPVIARGQYSLSKQERYALDARLSP
jgi:RES domain-containing protein